MKKCEVEEDWERCWRQSCERERGCTRKAACAPAERQQHDKEPVSAEALAAGLKFCCGTEERLTLEIAALRNVVQRAMIAGCQEAFDAWNYYFPDKPMEPYKTPNVAVSGTAKRSFDGSA